MPNEERDPSLLEVNLRARRHKPMVIGDVVDGDDYKTSLKLVMRLDTRDDDKLLKYIAPREDLEKHNIGSITDWSEANTEMLRRMGFDRTYKDHQVRLKLNQKTIATFDDCELTTFDYDIKHNFFSFHILAKGFTGEQVAPLIDSGRALFSIEIKRAKHWSSQKTIFEHDEQQAEIPPAKRDKIERAKDVANKRNTDKANGRQTTTDPK